MTDWESRYQLGDMPWEKGRAAPPLLELLEKRDIAEWGDGTILVPGCGLGHDVRALAELGLEVAGLDVASSAIQRASAFPKAGRESYELGDFLDPAWRGERTFSAIWEHTCFCAIAPSDRDQYVLAAASCLSAGGLLAGVFFLMPYDAGDNSKGPPHGATVEELDDRFSVWFDRVDAWVPECAYPGREGREWLVLYRKRG